MRGRRTRAAVALMLASAAVWGASAPAADPARVEICFNYGCASRAAVGFEPATLDAVRDALAAAPSASAEREALARALGLMYREAGMQTPVAADRAGNFLDQEVEGRMDCIDHSTSTTRLLQLLEARGWLRFHRVVEPARRVRVLFQHFSAVIEEVEAPPPPVAVDIPDHVPLLLALCDCADVADDIPRPPPPPPGRPGERYAIDSWFVDNGEPAVVLPLADWLDGEGPNVH